MRRMLIGLGGILLLVVVLAAAGVFALRPPAARSPQPAVAAVAPSVVAALPQAALAEDAPVAMAAEAPQRAEAAQEATPDVNAAISQEAPTTAPTAPPPTPTATSGPPPTPTPRPAGTPLRVGVQVGHWKINELPEELSRLRGNSGAASGGFTEVQVNLDVAQRVAALLQDQGIVVDILPATIPPGYDADAFVAIHADGVQSSGPRGFKLATPWRTSRAAQHLMDAIVAEYAAATKLPQDGSVTFNMKGYYAFNYFRNTYAVAKTTPAVIVEMGFLTNPSDRALLTRQPDRVANGISAGILRYLRERDPNDGAALLPPEFKPQRALSPDGVDVRSAPHDDAPVLGRVGQDRRFTPIQERDGWYQVFTRVGERRFIGWVRKDQLQETTGPTPTPPPPTG